VEITITKTHIRRIVLGVLVVGLIFVLTAVPIRASIDFEKLAPTKDFGVWFIQDYLNVQTFVDWFVGSVWDPIAGNNIFVILITVLIAAMGLMLMVSIKRQKRSSKDANQKK